MAVKRMTVSLKDQDQQAVKLIQSRFRLLSQNDAIRFALRVLALSPRREEPAPLPLAKKQTVTPEQSHSGAATREAPALISWLA
jgi:hypothetical protein